MEAQANIGRRVVPVVRILSARFRLSPGSLKPTRIKLGWELAIFAGIALFALGLRLWELDGRAMHYDESLHLHYAWRLAIGDGYAHSPWMHGPFQVELTSLVFKLFSDTDFTGRLAYAFFGSALVMLPYFLRTYLGRAGAVVTSILLALSPSLLYFSRFGRNDILMAVWAVALLILMWRYLNEGKNRYLYMASAVLALAFATKETSYIIVAIFGAALLLMSLTEFVPWVMGRTKLSDLKGAPGFLILLVTLTLPQWSALTSLVQDAAGVVLARTEGGTGDVGFPALEAPFVSFPVGNLPSGLTFLVIAAIVVVPLGTVFLTKVGRRWARWILPVAAVAALGYSMVSLSDGIVARNYLISFGVLLATLAVSVVIGIMWNWKVWLICAGIFYVIWTMLYTSVFGFFVQPHGYCSSEIGNTFGFMCSKFGGVFTGSWQSLGYWLAQQDVARGTQPWYYHFLLGGVYEFLPMIFGLIAIVYYLRKGDLFGLFLGFWAILTFAAYVKAGEKMPWLIVNLTLPFIILAGKFIGEIIERLRWRRVLRGPPLTLFILAPLLVVAGITLLYRFMDRGSIDSWQGWGLLAVIITIAVVSVFLIKLARPGVGLSLASLGVATLMLGFSTFVAFRASYTYDDSPIEMLVYAQGSADIVDVADTLDARVIGQGANGQVVDVDRELWYPFNWYVRDEQKEGSLGFRCYKNDKEAGYATYCKPLEEPPSTDAVLLVESHANRDSKYLGKYEKAGPFKNLLWFPETYRRPGEKRKNEGFTEQIKKDYEFIKDTVASRESWKDALDYFLFRKVESQWWDSKFFSYIATDPAS